MRCQGGSPRQHQPDGQSQSKALWKWTSTKGNSSVTSESEFPKLSRNWSLAEPPPQSSHGRWRGCKKKRQQVDQENSYYSLSDKPPPENFQHYQACKHIGFTYNLQNQYKLKQCPVYIQSHYNQNRIN